MSWSRVSLLVSLCGAFVLTAAITLPKTLGRDAGLRRVEPGLLTFAPRATWSGRLSGNDARMPADTTVAFRGPRVTLGARVPRADAVLVHADQERGTPGRTPAMLEELLRPDARWLAGDLASDTEVFGTELGTMVALGPAGVHRGVDLRHKGHTDLHIWSSSATLSVTSYRRVVP